MLSPTHSRRRRQILEVLHRLGRASAAEVQAELPDAPGYSSVRTHLRILEDKGAVVHETDGQRFVYRPAVAPDAAQHRALHDVVRTFFKGNPGPAAVALISEARNSLSEEDLDRLSELIEAARREGR